MKAVHHKSNDKVGISKNQPSIQAIFLKAKNDTNLLDGLEIDLTNEKKPEETFENLDGTCNT